MSKLSNLLISKWNSCQSKYEMELPWSPGQSPSSHCTREKKIHTNYTTYSWAAPWLYLKLRALLGVPAKHPANQGCRQQAVYSCPHVHMSFSLLCEDTDLVVFHQLLLASDGGGYHESIIGKLTPQFEGSESVFRGWVPHDVRARLDVGLIRAPNHAANLCVHFYNRLFTLSHDEAFVDCQLVAGGLSAPGNDHLYLEMWNNINYANLNKEKRGKLN